MTSVVGPRSEDVSDLIAYLDSSFPEIESLVGASDVLSALKRKLVSNKDTYESLKSSEADRLRNAQSTARQCLAQVDGAQKQHQDLVDTLQRYLDDSKAEEAEDGARDAVAGLVEKVAVFESAGSYLRLVQHAEELHARCTTAMTMDPSEAIEPFTQLKEAQQEASRHGWDNFAGSLRAISAQLQAEMRTHLQAKFDSKLSALGWPGLVAVDNTPATDLAAFEAALRDVITFDEACAEGKKGTSGGNDDEGITPSDKRHRATGEPPLVIRLMLAPIEKRFRYHFHSDRKTNRLDKPEWFFAQCVSYIRTHLDFLANVIQPRVASAMSTASVTKHGPVDVTTCFINGLVFMVHFKLVADMPDLVQQPDLLIHTVNECMAFDEFLHSDLVLYPPQEPGCLSFFTDRPDMFEEWIDVERQRVMDQISDIFDKGAAPWSLAFDVGDIEFDDTSLESVDSDHLKVTQAAEKLISLFELLTQRFGMLDLELQLRFVQRIQMAVLRHFEARIAAEAEALFSFQAKSADEASLKQYASLANTLDFVDRSLRDATDGLGHVELYQYAVERDLLSRGWTSDDETASSHEADSSSENGEGESEKHEKGADEDSGRKQSSGGDDNDVHEYDLEGTLFDHVFERFERLSLSMLNSAIRLVVREFERNMQPYASQKLLSFEADAHTQRELSPEICEPLAELKFHVFTLEKALTRQVFTKVWKSIASGVSDVAFDCVIMRRAFTRNAALQFEYDMKGLQALFASYTKRPGAHLYRVREAVDLLTLAPSDLEDVIAVVGPPSLHSQRLATKLVSTGADLVSTGAGYILSKLTNGQQGHHDTQVNNSSKVQHDPERATQVLADLSVFRLSVADASRVCARRVDTVQN